MEIIVTHIVVPLIMFALVFGFMEIVLPRWKAKRRETPRLYPTATSVLTDDERDALMFPAPVLNGSKVACPRCEGNGIVGGRILDAKPKLCGNCMGKRWVIVSANEIMEPLEPDDRPAIPFELVEP